MRIPVVDEKDEIVECKERETLDRADIYRVAALWVTNGRGKVLLAQRALTKPHSPGKWGPAVAGTVEEGETYEENIIKEAEEEIGLVDIAAIPGPKIKVSGEHNYFCQWFLLTLDKPTAEFQIRKSEVEQVRWISHEDLEKEMQQNQDTFVAGIQEWKTLF